MKRIPLFVIAGLLLLPTPATSQKSVRSFAIKGSETIEMFNVYYIGRSCHSLLKSFGGIDVLSGPPEVTLDLKEQKVQARREDCQRTVNGAVVTATGKDITVQSTSKVTFRVRYNTVDGPRQAIYTVELGLYP